MKLKTLLFTLVTVVIALTGCQSNKDNRIDYSGSNQTATDFIDVSESKISQMIESKESFIIYVYSATCGTCHEVSARLKDIISEYGITIYRTTHVGLSASNPLKLSSGVPILGFYKEGVKLKIIGYANAEKDFESKEAIITLMEKYVIFPLPKVAKINFQIGDKTITDFIDINEDKISQMIDSKESFIVYVYSATCSTCQDVSTRLKDIINEYGITIYRTTHVGLSASNPLKLSSGVPILGFYKEGEKLKIIGYANAEKDFESKEAIISLMEKYVILPSKVFYIDVEELRKKITDGDDFLILFTRRTCPDCSFLFGEFLDDYILNNTNKELFLIECDVLGIRYDIDGNLDTAMWDDFKNEFDLPKTANDEFGYRLGHVPTFQYYEDGVLSGSAVYLNDVYTTVALDELVEDSNVRYRYTITESFYSDLIETSFERTFTYKESTIKSVLTVGYRNGMLDAHNQKLKVFLDSH